MADDQTTDTSSNIDVGGQSYTQDELNKLVELGKIGLEAETRFNTKIERVWPEYTKATSKVKELEAKVQEFESKAAQQPQPQYNPNTSGISETERLQALQTLKALGVITKEDLRQELDPMLDPILEQRLTQRETASRILVETRELEKKYDGSDGRPKFDAEEVLTFMRDNNVMKPEIAYKILKEDDLDNWRASNIAKARKPGLDTETRSAGSKQPRTMPDVTKDNINELVREVMEFG